MAEPTNAYDLSKRRASVRVCTSQQVSSSVLDDLIERAEKRGYQRGYAAAESKCHTGRHYALEDTDAN